MIHFPPPIFYPPVSHQYSEFPHRFQTYVPAVPSLINDFIHVPAVPSLINDFILHTSKNCHFCQEEPSRKRVKNIVTASNLPRAIGGHTEVRPRDVRRLDPVPALRALFRHSRYTVPPLPLPPTMHAIRQWQQRHAFSNLFIQGHIIELDSWNNSVRQLSTRSPRAQHHVHATLEGDSRVVVTFKCFLGSDEGEALQN
jgi:hypothetical protein